MLGTLYHEVRMQASIQAARPSRPLGARCQMPDTPLVLTLEAADAGGRPSLQRAKIGQRRVNCWARPAPRIQTG
jgi:hypothetical protein